MSSPTPEQFANHLHGVIETYDVLSERDTTPPDVSISCEGMTITLSLNADTYESLVALMKEEQKWV
jgi:hypothetical protein